MIGLCEFQGFIVGLAAGAGFTYYCFRPYLQAHKATETIRQNVVTIQKSHIDVLKEKIEYANSELSEERESFASQLLKAQGPSNRSIEEIVYLLATLKGFQSILANIEIVKPGSDATIERLATVMSLGVSPSIPKARHKELVELGWDGNAPKPTNNNELFIYEMGWIAGNLVTTIPAAISALTASIEATYERGRKTLHELKQSSRE